MNRDHSKLERDQSKFSGDGGGSGSRGGREGIRKSESVSERDRRDGRRVIRLREIIPVVAESESDGATERSDCESAIKSDGCEVFMHGA